jgi:cytosine/adenosine deaminase-related metal-dependent hydrolase
LIFSGTRSLIDDVMVGGKWVVRSGRHPLGRRAATQFRRAVARLLA